MKNENEKPRPTWKHFDVQVSPVVKRILSSPKANEHISKEIDLAISEEDEYMIFRFAHHLNVQLESLPFAGGAVPFNVSGKVKNIITWLDGIGYFEGQTDKVIQDDINWIVYNIELP